MKVTPPTNLWGLPIAAHQGVAPTEIDSVAVALSGGPLAQIRLLRWELRDFEFTDSRLNPDGNGWVLTLTIDVTGALAHLWQSGGAFHTTDGRRLRYVDAPRSHGSAYPRWHRKSERLWPVMDSEHLPFRGQFRTAGFVGYVFGDVENSTMSVLLYEADEQDLEDHYASEEQ